MRKMVPILLLLLTACGVTTEASLPRNATLPPAAQSDPAPDTTDITAPTVDYLLEIVRQAYESAPSSYRFESSMRAADDAGEWTVQVDGEANGHDRAYRVSGPGGLQSVIRLGDSAWMQVAGQWVSHSPATLPDPVTPLPSSYAEAVREASRRLAYRDGSVELVEPRRTAAEPTVHYRVEIPDLQDIPIGGTRSIDLWFDQGTLVRLTYETEPPPTWTGPTVTSFSWQISEIDSPIEILPPDPDAVVISSTYADEYALAALGDTVFLLSTICTDGGDCYPSVAQIRHIEPAYDYTRDFATITPGVVGFDTDESSLFVVTESYGGRWLCQQWDYATGESSIAWGHHLEQIDTRPECAARAG
jgi:hypothetical protein